MLDDDIIVIKKNHMCAGRVFMGNATPTDGPAIMIFTTPQSLINSNIG